MIETERLLLRPHRREDFTAYLAMNSDPVVMEFIASGAPLTREDIWNKFIRNAGHWPILGFGLFAIIDKVDDAYLGQCGLAEFGRGIGEDFDPYPEASWALTSAAQGHGYAGEAMAGALDWLERERGPGRTVCIVDAQNDPSLLLAERLGYRAYGEAIYKEKRVVKLERLPNS